MDAIKWYRTGLARSFVSWALVIICAFVIVYFVVQRQQEELSNSNAATLPYDDDGQGLVLIQTIGTQVSVYKAIQAWRGDHPDRFNRHVSIVTSSSWNGVIISYKP